ncbi:AAA-domain-containing protein [Melanomma pulvis-pyrius CBS 109.77]|uniref:AAA-domain-containing protein n=1 Tax=Melanomma pulvis-pyrius CBS 109.77 TaxID=1314802 RepID=A0A6A6XNB5_9PLEO|nr:AAA-domain-containing protein [Melanomma pulvis-pyrius CBS 109.77]
MATHQEKARLTTSRQPAYKKPTLFIEVQLNEQTSDDFLFPNDIRREVHEWLEKSFHQVTVAQHLDAKSLLCYQSVRSLEITDYSHAKVYPDKTWHALTECDLDIAVYSLFDGRDEEYSASQPGDENSPHFNVTQLPHTALDGLWESLIFAEPIPQLQLRILTRMMRISKELHLNPAVICWHNLVLLYGPPGSGKTTLAQALAQKLSIRLSQAYSAIKLVEINSSTLLSKWFGESSKLVGKLFETISTICLDESLLTVVLIDEVESMAGSREKASQGNECSDAIRSTNELLQGLDRLRRHPNVIFIFTSNLIDNIDPAFVDRCRIKQYVGIPSVKCVYEIFRSVINELIRTNLVLFDSSDLDHTTSPLLHIKVSAPPQDESYGGAPETPTFIPEFEWVITHLSNRHSTAPWELQEIARLAEGLSGRTLRGLPMLAMTKYTMDEPCDLRDLLAALRKAIKEEGNVTGKSDGGPDKQKHAVGEEDLASADQLDKMSLSDDDFLTTSLFTL